jgi:hypothetical protein
MNNDLERMWKEAAVGCFKVLSQHMPGKTEENHEISSVRIGGDLAEIRP